jgi:hypothetical protein
MYQWYQSACLCLVYLADFEELSTTDSYEAFADSRWFTRGWTIQEVIAPPIVEFYNASWLQIGTRLSLQDDVALITGIATQVLCGGDVAQCTVAVRILGPLIATPRGWKT